MRLRALVGTLSLVTLALVGCGGTDPKFAAASGTISQADATANKTAIVSGAVLSFSSPTGKPSVRDVDAFDACTTKTPDPAVDADSDHISTQTRTYACTNVALRDGTQNQNGTATVTDKDDADPKSGFRFEYAVTGSHSGGETWDFAGFWDLTKSDTSMTYSSDYAGTYTFTRSGSGTSGGTWSHTITPTDMANPYTGGGAITMSGYYAYNFTISSVTTNFVFSMSSTNLTYGANPCSGFYNGGSYTYTDASANTITVEFTACGTYTVKYNGTTI